MLSPIPFPKVPLITLKSSQSNTILLIILLICSLSLLIWKGFALLPICLGYIITNTFYGYLKMRPKSIYYVSIYSWIKKYKVMQKRQIHIIVLSLFVGALFGGVFGNFCSNIT